MTLTRTLNFRLQFLPRLLLALLISTWVAGCGKNSSPEEHLRQAETYVAEGNERAAIIELKSALQQNANLGEARLLLGQLSLETGDVLSARKELDRARRLDVPESDIAPYWARVLLSDGDVDELLAMESGELDAPGRASVLAAQAVAHAISGDGAAALEAVDEALQLDPASSYAMTNKARIYFALGELEQAKALLDTIVSSDTPQPEAWLIKGDVEASEGLIAEAESSYSMAVEDSRLGLEARLRRAFLRLQAGDNEAASEDVDVLLEKVPHHPGVNYARGVILYIDGQYQESVSAFAIAERDKRRYPRALFYSGTAHFTLGNMDQAAGFANQFHNMQPADVPGRKLLAAVLLTQKNFDRAEELMQPVVAMHPEDVAALNLLSNALMSQGKTEEGIEMLNRIAELEPESSAAQIRLGASLLMKGDSARGVETLETAIELNPEYQQADILLVLNYLGQKDFDSALAAAQAYKSRNPADITPRNLIGRVYAAKGDTDQARAAFESALELQPGEPNALLSLAALDEQAGDLEASRAHYEAILQHNPGFLRAMLKLAEIDGRAGDTQAMVTGIEAAVEANPDSLEARVVLARAYLATGQPERVALVFSELDDTEKSVPIVLAETARAQLALRDYSAARFTLNKLAQTGQGTAQLHHQKALAAAGLERVDEVERELEKSLAADPNFLPSMLAMARLQMRKGNFESADELLDRMLELAPEYPPILVFQTQLTTAKGDYGDALVLARQNYATAPTTDTLLQLAALLKREGLDSEALKLQEEWQQSNPEDVNALLAIAVTYMELGRDDDVLDAYRAVLELDEGNLIALNNLAWNLLEEDAEAALDYARRAEAVSPQSADVLDTLALAYFHTGELDKARRTLERALDARPDDASMLYHRAMMAAASGESDMARRTLEELLASGKTFPEKDKAAELLASL